MTTSLELIRGGEVDFVEELVGSVFPGAQSERHLDLRLRHVFLSRLI